MSTVVNIDTTIEEVAITATTTIEEVEINATTTIEQVEVTVTEGGGGGESVAITNSDATYNATATPPIFVLPDTDYNIYVNTVFYATTSLPTLAP